MHLPVGELGVGVSGRFRHAQASFIDALGGRCLSGSEGVLLVDSTL